MMPFSPKIVFTDIDGVWTDGGMYYDERGNEFKKFNTSDSAGIIFLKRLGIPACIITGESSNAVIARANKLQVEHVITGSKSKLNDAQSLLAKLDINIKEAAFIGDDINDIELLNAVGFSCAPISAPTYIRSQVDYVSAVAGGNGAFRCFIEHLIIQMGYNMDWFVNSK